MGQYTQLTQGKRYHIYAFMKAGFSQIHDMPGVRKRDHRAQEGPGCTTESSQKVHAFGTIHQGYHLPT